MFPIISLTNKVDFDWTGLYRPRLLLAFTRLSCKDKIKNKMFKKNVKGMQQNIKREFWLAYYCNTLAL